MNEPSAVIVDAPAPLEAWQEWLGDWERFLTAALALPENPDAAAPDLPDTPIPFGPVPPELTERLLRAQAVKDAAITALTAKMAQLRPGRTFHTPVPPSTGPTIDL